MLQGAVHTEKTVVLTHTEAYAAQLRKLTPKTKVISMHGIEDLIGRKSPLVVDNSALMDICESASNAIELGENHVRRLVADKKALADTNDRMLRETRRLEGKIEELRSVATALLEWIDAVPKDTVLPAMPGIDRDWVEKVIHAP